MRMSDSEAVALLTRIRDGVGVAADNYRLLIESFSKRGDADRNREAVERFQQISAGTNVGSNWQKMKENFSKRGSDLGPQWMLALVKQISPP